MHRVVETSIEVFPIWTTIVMLIFGFIGIYLFFTALYEKSLGAFVLCLVAFAIAGIPFGTQHHKGVDKRHEVQVIYNGKAVWVPAIKIENGEWYPKRTD